MIAAPDVDSLAKMYADDVRGGASLAGARLKLRVAAHGAGVDADEAESRFVAMVDTAPVVAVEAKPLPTQPYRTLRKVVDDVANKPRPPALIPHFLAPGQVGVLAGSPKSGKSEFSAYVVASVSRGLDVLGTSVEASDVVVVTEESDHDLVDKFSRYGADLDRVHVLNPDGGANVETFRALIDDVALLAASTGARLVIVDTFAAWANLAGDDERNEGVVGPLVRALRPLKVAGVAVLLVHHTVKNTEADGVAAIRGSGALAAEVESFAVFRETSGGGVTPTRRTLTTWSRSFGRTKTTIERIDGADGGEPHYRIVGADDERAERAEAANNSERKVVRELQRVWAWMPKRALSEATGLSARTLDAVLARAVDASRIQRRGAGHSGSPFVYAAPGVPVSAAPDSAEREPGSDDDVKGVS